MKIKGEYLLLAGVTLIGLVLIIPTFKLSLSGDDWLAIWNYRAINATGTINSFKHFFSLYGPQDTLMGILSQIFGYNGFPYYLLSFILRSIAALTLFPLTYHLTKERLSAFLAVLIFTASFIGLEATNWVFNMNVYLAIACINISIYFFLISQQKSKSREIVWSLIFFFLAHFVAPSRVSLFLIIFIVLETTSVIKSRKILLSIKRILPFILIFITFKIIGDYGNTYFTKLIIDNLKEGNFNIQFIKKIFITTGNLITPSDGFTNRIFGIIGIIFYFLVLSLVYLFRKSKKITALIIPFLMIVTGIATPLLIWPDFNYGAVHRHLVLSAPGFAIFGGVLFSLNNNKILKTLILSCIVLAITININSIKNYTDYLLLTRSQDLHDIVWKQIMSTMPDPSSSPDPKLFYFTGDQASIPVVSDIIYFGFPSKVGVLYNIYPASRLPSIVDRYEMVQQILKEGRTLDNISFQPVPTENFYAYRLEDRIKLKDITKEIRTKLSNLAIE